VFNVETNETFVVEIETSATLSRNNQRFPAAGDATHRKAVGSTRKETAQLTLGSVDDIVFALTHVVAFHEPTEIADLIGRERREIRRHGFEWRPFYRRL
jgi:hypothetical protein